MAAKRQSFPDELRQAIERSGKTRYRISNETGIAESVLSRFMHGKSGLSMESVDLICGCLGLRLVGPDKPRRQKGR